MNRQTIQYFLFLIGISIGLNPATASDLFTYQGKLANAMNMPLSDGQYRIGVRIWENAAPPAQNPENEVPLWARKYEVPVQGGVFSLMVGAPGEPWSAPEPLTSSLKLALSGGNRYLDITVMSDANGPEKPAAQWQTLQPRQSLNAVPYAMNGVPTGTVVAFAGAIAPEGWLICDGTTTLPMDDPRYRQLHTTIGNAFNNGAEPAGHFRLPDMRGRTAIGTGAGDTRGPDDPQPATNWLRGMKFGTERHKMSLAEMPRHSHSGETSTDGEHTHSIERGDGTTVTWGDGSGSSTNRIDAAGGGSGTIRARSAGAHKHTIAEEGNDQPHNNMQPSLVLNYIIKL